MKVISRDELVAFLDAELGLSQFPDDSSRNGLQVEGREKVKRVGIAVDACDFVFREAAERGIDFLFVHHGLIWGSVTSLTGVLLQRIKSLLAAELSLYACHLPLDWHPRYGNNAEILRMLSIRKKGEFGEYHGKRIGYWGMLAREIPLDLFVSRVEDALGTKCTSISFGRRVRRVGVVSGGGGSAISDVSRLNIDTFLTGEPAHSAYTIAEELGVNLVFAGHYATEATGIRAVGRMLSKRFGVSVEFIDHPTGL